MHNSASLFSNLHIVVNPEAGNDVVDDSSFVVKNNILMLSD